MWPRHRRWLSVPTVTIGPIVTIGTIILIRIATTGRIGPIMAGIPTAIGGEVGAAVSPCDPVPHAQGELMNSIIYIVGVVVIVLVILWFFGLR
jgi:hypothetical protein